MQKLDLLNLRMRTHAQLSSIANQIIHLSNKCTSLTHIHQIQAQLILQNLRSNSNVAHHFITACHSHSLDQLYSALFLFTQLPKPHIFIYNTLIRAFSHARTPYVPNYIYVLMHKNSVFPNNYTFPFLLKSLTDFKQFKQGQCMHTHVVKLGHFNDIYVQNALLNVYSSCGRMRLCQQVFGEMPMRDVVSWTILIMGFGRSGKYGDALIAFEHMKYAGIEPNHVTMVNALAACGNIGAIDMGVWIHDYVRSKGWELDVILGTSLVDMYGKCGRVEESLNVFRSMTEKNTLTWNVLVKMLGLAKSGEAAVWWFDRMVQEGFKVDDVTLVAVLSACSHSGLIDKARQIFLSLREGKYGILPSVKHYACMIDLLSRSGCLSDAFYYIREMPFEPTKSMWGSLLAGCRHHGNLELGEIAAKNLVQLEPQNSAYYVLLSNLYAEMGRWDDVTNVRELMKERGLAKDKGCSSVELQVQSHDTELLAV